MSLLPTTLNFGETTLAIIDRNGEPWLSARELARALGYQDESAVLRIYARNADEFTEEMTLTVKLTVRRCTAVPDSHLLRPRLLRDRLLRKDRSCEGLPPLGPRRPRGPHQGQRAEQCRLVPLLGLTRKRWGQMYTPHGFNSVSLNAALVLDYLLAHCDDGQWHALSHREIGGAIGISHTSVRNVLVRLDEWGLITRETERHPETRAVTRALGQDPAAAEARSPQCRRQPAVVALNHAQVQAP
jgi:hypothetical protein